MQGSNDSATTGTGAALRRPGRLRALASTLALAVLFIHAAFAAARAAPPGEGERCVRHEQGRIECRTPGTDAFVYSWPVTPDMAGQTLDVSSLTLGVSVYPPVQAVAAGQSQATFELKGATPGQTVKLAKKLLKAEQEKGSSAESCCIEEFEITVPQAKICTQQVALRTPRPAEQSKPPGPPARVLIEKACAACAAGGACRCKITVRNVGTEPLSGPVRFRDETRFTGGEDDGGTARIDSITPDGDDWDCTGPPKSLRCELPAQSLKPVSSRSVIVTLEPREPQSGQGARMRNCVSLQGDNPGYTIVGNREACADLGGDITVRKSGGSNCRLGEQCSFDVTIANRGKGAYIGPLMLADDMTLGKTAGRKAEIVSINPPLGCASEPRALPFACSANVVLQGGKSRTHRIVVRLPQDGDGKGGDGELSGRNCFAAGAASGDRNAPDETVVSLLKASKASVKSQTGSEDARACVAFTAVPRCPGDLVLQGSQCACPGGTERVDDDRCRPACGPGERLRGGECVSNERRSGPVVPIPIPLPYQPPREPSYQPPPDRGDCLPGEFRVGSACFPRRPPQGCPGDLKRYGTPPNDYCGCREGLIRYGIQCRAAPLPVPAPIVCTGDLKLYGAPGNQYCGCQPGQVQKGNTCKSSAPPRAPIVCPGDLKPYGPLGNQYCGCPQGQVQKGNSCTSSAPPRAPIVCPGDLKPYGPLGNQYCGCPQGQVQKGNTCASSAPTPAPCPGDLVRLGDPKPYCGCKPGLIQQGTRCVAPPRAPPRTPSPPPPTTCPDGSKVPAGQACPRPKVVYKTCSDGSRIPVGDVCPRPKIVTKTCPDGSRIPQGEACPRPKPPPPPPRKPPPPPPPPPRRPPPVIKPPPKPAARCPPGMSGTPPNCRTILR